MRRLILSLSIVLFVLEMKATMDAKVVTINVWHPWWGNNFQVYGKLVDEFMKTHPTIKVSTTVVPSDQIDQKLHLALAANAAPHVVWGYPALTQRLTGAVLPLDPFLKETRFDTSDIYPGYWQGAKFDGGIYGIPIEANAVAIIYNREMFSDAGIPYPTDDWTWNDMETIARKLTRDTNSDGTPERWGFQLWWGATWHVMPWLRANGGDVLNEAGTKSAIFSRANIETLNFFLNLVYVYKAMPRDYIGGALRQGKVAMEQGSSFTFSLEGVEDDHRLWGSVLHPIPPDPAKPGKKPHNSMLLIKYLYGMKHTPEEDRATFEFLRWFTSTEVNTRWALETGYLPIRKSSIQSKDYQEYLRRRPGFAGIIRAQQYCEPLPFWLPYWTQIAGMVEATLRQVFYQEAAPENALADLDRRINAAISQAMRSK